MRLPERYVDPFGGKALLLAGAIVCVSAIPAALVFVGPAYATGDGGSSGSSSDSGPSGGDASGPAGDPSSPPWGFSSGVSVEWTGDTSSGLSAQEMDRLRGIVERIKGTSRPAPGTSGTQYSDPSSPLPGISSSPAPAPGTSGVQYSDPSSPSSSGPSSSPWPAGGYTGGYAWESAPQSQFEIPASPISISDSAYRLECSGCIFVGPPDPMPPPTPMVQERRVRLIWLVRRLDVDENEHTLIAFILDMILAILDAMLAAEEQGQPITLTVHVAGVPVVIDIPREALSTMRSVVADTRAHLAGVPTEASRSVAVAALAAIAAAANMPVTEETIAAVLGQLAQEMLGRAASPIAAPSLPGALAGRWSGGGWPAGGGGRP